MNQISIGFSRHNNSFLSWMIRELEDSAYSHVYVRCKSKYGEYVYQASGLSVNFTNIQTFKERNEILEEYSFELSDDQKDKLFTFFVKYVGRPYNIKALFQIALIMSCKRVGLEPKFPDDGKDSFICSELAALLCEEILMIPIKEDDNFISPKDLHPYVAKYGIRMAYV